MPEAAVRRNCPAHINGGSVRAEHEQRGGCVGERGARSQIGHWPVWTTWTRAGPNHDHPFDATSKKPPPRVDHLRNEVPRQSSSGRCSAKHRESRERIEIG
jgi:hypothetical protein